MAILYKEPANVGDTVYDLMNGSGTIIETHGDSLISVKFHSGKTVVFTDGKVHGISRLFWHNPLTVAPPKNKDTWEKFKVIIAQVASLLY